MNHQRAISRHGLDHARKIGARNRFVESENAVVYGYIDPLAELDDERTFAGGKIARRDGARHVRGRANGAILTPAPCRRARTAPAMAAAFG